MIFSSDKLTIWVNAVSNALTVLLCYTEYIDIFSEKNTEKLSFHQSCNYTINTENYKSSYNLLYNLSKTELQILKEYLDDILMKK